MYEAGDIPNDYMVNKTVTVPKKVRANECENYRTISFITLRVGKPTFITSVNLEKAFEKVSWPKLIEIFNKKGMKYKDRKSISSLY